MEITEKWAAFVQARAEEWMNGTPPTPDQGRRLAGQLRIIAEVCEAVAAGVQPESGRGYRAGLSDAVFCIMYGWNDHPDYPPRRHGSGFAVTVTPREPGTMGG